MWTIKKNKKNRTNILSLNHENRNSNVLCCSRAEKADIYRSAAEPQDYEMVEFFIKRLKLWIGLRKAKEVSFVLSRRATWCDSG